MILFARIVLTTCLIGILLFCVVGYLATYEPGDKTVMMNFRLLYGFAGAASIGGLFALWRKKPTMRD